MYELFFGSGIAHTVAVFSVVIALGVLLGKIKVRGVSLGITWVLFAGIFLSHIGMRIEPSFLGFVKEFGLPSGCRSDRAFSRLSSVEGFA